MPLKAGVWDLVGFPGLCWPHPPFPAPGEGCLSPSPPFYSTQRILEVRGWALPASSSKEPSRPIQWSSTNLNKHVVPTLITSSYYFISHIAYPQSMSPAGPSPDRHLLCAWCHTEHLIQIDTFKLQIDLVTLGCQDQSANEAQSS